MPTFNSFALQQVPGQRPQPSPQAVAITGPIIPVQIEIAKALAQSLQAANQPIPSPVVGIALIDTGASITSFDMSVAVQLGINPNGVAQVGTAGGPQQLSTYQARFTFPGTPIPGFEHARVLGCNLAGQTVLNQQPVLALIGRDVLRLFVFVYNGTVGMWSVSM
jgi:hypothetical protein